MIKAIAYNCKAEELKKLRLALLEEEQGVTLLAVDEQGQRIMGGLILTITNQGVIYRHTNVSTELGLIITEEGNVLTSDDPNCYYF